jgi:predicted double-glycine peptidase
MFEINENTKIEIIMDNSSQNYRNQVWQFLDNMKHGEFIVIANISKPENQNQFISCVKSYMLFTKKPFQGNITFNFDYSKIYKTDEITFKTIKK